MDLTVEDAERAVRVLRDQLPDAELTHARALEIVARQLGFQDWSTASARLPARRDVGVPVPVLRSFDETRAREFYIDYLHFSVEWEHRFDHADSLCTCGCAAISSSWPVRASRRRHSRFDSVGAGRRRQGLAR